MTQEEWKRHFNFYGLTIQVSSSAGGLVDELHRDFAYFHVPAEQGKVNVYLYLSLSPIPYETLPSVKASLSTPRNICFRNGKITYIDYFGKGLVVFDRGKGQCHVYGMEYDLIHEIAYLFILSTVGQHLDSRGIHRIHALGVSYNHRGILVLLSSGGGKSTLALELLRQPGFLLLSEDTPLINRQGKILPFPLRLGIRPGEATGIPQEYLRTLRRMEFDPKTLVDIDYFHDRLGQAVEPSVVMIGERNLGEVSEIVPLAIHQSFGALFRYMVIGLGIYQGLEFMLERGPWEVLGKGGLVASRLFNGIRLLLRTRAYRFILGRNIEKNCKTLLDFLRNHTI